MRSESMPALWQAIWFYFYVYLCVCMLYFVCCILSLFFTSVAACGTTTTELLRWVFAGTMAPGASSGASRVWSPGGSDTESAVLFQISFSARQHQYIINRAMHLRCIGEILMFINKAPWCFTGVPICQHFPSFAFLWTKVSHTHIITNPFSSFFLLKN